MNKMPLNRIAEVTGLAPISIYNKIALMSLAERAIATASTARRTRYGYGAYNPENLTNVMEIFGVFYNYCKVGDEKQTPAMRLVLAKAPIALEDVLYFEGDSGIARANKKVAPITGTTFNQAQL
jgi:hypothetical protein